MIFSRQQFIEEYVRSIKDDAPVEKSFSIMIKTSVY